MIQGTLFIVATPIGNLSDMTFRAVETLKASDMILCEDTRVTKKLVNQYQVSAELLSYHQHSPEQVKWKIFDALSNGKNISLVTDAGTPGVSDPGNELIDFLLRENPAVSIVPIPGASSVTAAVSVSGFPAHQFLFLGFPPHKKGRNKFFAELGREERTAVLLESSHRIKKTLTELSRELEKNRRVCVCRELTKKFETIYRGTISEIAAMNISEKGEFVVVIEGGGGRLREVSPVEL